MGLWGPWVEGTVASPLLLWKCQVGTVCLPLCLAVLARAKHWGRPERSPLAGQEGAELAAA